MLFISPLDSNYKDEGIMSGSVTSFLDHQANDRGVSINTQKLVLNALAFLYNKFLEKPVSKPARLPTVM